MIKKSDKNNIKWYIKLRVNSQLPFEIVSFVNYPSEINKTSITHLKLHNVNQFTPSVKYFC